MKKFAYSTIGTFHLNHNEDAILITPLDHHILLLAVMDGCSMGTDSHFASTLMAKTLRKIANDIHYKAFVAPSPSTLSELLEQILRTLFSELKFIRNRLLLEREELLSTLLLGLVNSQNQKAEVICIGDGLIHCNGQYIEYEQDNQPDYLGYHLDEDFDTWFQEQTQLLSLSNINDLSLSSDGIFTFKTFNTKSYTAIEEQSIIDYLLIDKQWEKQENMLKKKVFYIEQEYGLKPSDDLSILRVILK